jgi:hypothetical protein
MTEIPEDPIITFYKSNKERLRSIRAKDAPTVLSAVGIAVLLLLLVMKSCSGRSGSDVVFKVHSVTWTQNSNFMYGSEDPIKESCAKIDESQKYEKLVSDGWKIVSATAETRVAPYDLYNGKCVGTLYVLSR